MTPTAEQPYELGIIDLPFGRRWVYLELHGPELVGKIYGLGGQAVPELVGQTFPTRLPWAGKTVSVRVMDETGKLRSAA